MQWYGWTMDTPEATIVSIDVYDVSGRLVENLLNQDQQAGQYSTIWNSASRDGTVTSGIYFVRMSADGLKVFKKSFDKIIGTKYIYVTLEW
jgi:hypothetical protein